MINGEKIKKYFTILLAIQLFLSHAGIIYAQSADYTQKGTNPVSSQIEKYLCAPTDTSKSGGNTAVYSSDPNNNDAAAHNLAQNDLFNCINKLYRFAIALGAAVGLFFIVISGYLYMSAEGNQESVDKAKSIFTS